MPISWGKEGGGYASARLFSLHMCACRAQPSQVRASWRCCWPRVKHMDIKRADLAALKGALCFAIATHHALR